MSYMDASKSPTERASLLLAEMTIEEKIGQLVQHFGWHSFQKQGDSFTLTDEFKQAVQAGMVGSLYGTLRADPWTGVQLNTGFGKGEGAKLVNAIQAYVKENSRLGIPLLMGEECSHGHMAIDGTVFPVPLLMGSSWNTALYKKVSEAIAKETRSQGGHITYSPVLDVIRDPRWGRTEECYGEDPYLIGEFAVAAVEGFQGDSLAADDTVGVTLKHFVAYGSSEGGMNAGPVHMGQRELMDMDMYPFYKAIKAGAVSIMPAYHEIDGIPCTANRELIQDVVRDEWGFDGYVITDCGAIEMLYAGHDIAENKMDAGVIALKSGIDMEMSGVVFSQYLKQAYEKGLVSEEEINLAAQRILKIKFELGLFENTEVDAEKAKTIINQEQHKQLAHDIATEGIVLLKNSNHFLPLNKTSKPKIALIGPNADHYYNQLGDYTSVQRREHIITVRDALNTMYGDEAESNVLYAPGCRINGSDRAGFELAINHAQQADIVLMVMGGSSTRDFGVGTVNLKTGQSIVTGNDWSDMDCGEGIDRASLTLSGVQLDLIKEVYAVNQNIVVVWISGRPVIEPWVYEQIPAILNCWYPGQMGGQAIVDLLFGLANPSGKLTMSFPQSTGQIPVFYNAKRTRGRRYLEFKNEPLFPFGYGLSYAHFEYHSLRTNKEHFTIGEPVQVEVEIENTSDVAGAEIVQLYIKDIVSSVARPIKELKGFQKINFAAKERKTVSFTLHQEAFAFTGKDGIKQVEAGRFSIMVGTNSRDVLKTEINLVEET